MIMRGISNNSFMMQGALCTILSTTLAASIAYTVARGLGKSFAKRIVDKEVGGGPGKRTMLPESELLPSEAELSSLYQGLCSHDSMLDNPRPALAL